MELTDKDRLIRFGVYELVDHGDKILGCELRKQGRPLRIQDQPLQVLRLLLESPGVVVSRDDIRKQLWPDGTFVDFDHSLNTAINKVREILEDSAVNPRFIETVPKRGYRFIAPAEVVERMSEDSRATLPLEPHISAAVSADGSLLGRVLSRPEQLPRPPQATVRTLFLLAQFMYLCFYVASLARLREIERIFGHMDRFGLWALAVLIIAAVAGIPARLYLITAVLLRAPGLKQNFLKLFPALFLLDELWALAPFLLIENIGFGLAFGATAALLYLPFAQRSLVLMGAATFSPGATSEKQTPTD